MRAARAGGGQVAAPDVAQRLRVEDSRRIAGRYVAAAGAEIELVDTGRGMVLRSGGREGRLIRSGDVLATDHPAFLDKPLHRDVAGKDVRALWWGETLFARNRRADPPATPDRLRRLAGWYQGSDAWAGGVILRARGSRLAVDSANGTNWDSGYVLAEHDDYWTLGDADTVERLRFEAPVAGQPALLNFSAIDMPRLTLTSA